ncbi:MAG: ABC transporter permease, partial [Chrysiogenetes bacterium]|nr:ABC transporter permease [Chrysiogenetes bacterium]
MSEPPAMETGPIEEPRGYWHRVYSQFRRDRMAVLGIALIAVLGATALFADVLASAHPLVMRYQGALYAPIVGELPEELRAIAPGEIPAHLGEDDWALWAPIPYGPTQHDLERRLEPPSADHWLGTDDRGRDLLSRMVHGSRISLSVGFVSVGIALIIGVMIGAAAGYYGGKVDVVISRLIEVVICFPTFFLILAVIALLPPSMMIIMVVIGLTSWTGIARLIRAEVLKVRTMDYVQAARSLGVANSRIIFRHILPNSLAPAMVSATFGIAAAILVESSLAFLGFGVPPPTASWG